MIRDFFMTFLMIFYIFMNLIFLPKKLEISSKLIKNLGVKEWYN